MSSSSLIGFATAFLGLCWLGSALAGGLLSVFARRMRHQGPAHERRGARLALVVPPMAALVVVALLALASVGLFGIEDHCAVHDHHLHLCLTHGAAWGSQGWAVAILAGHGTFVAVAVLRHLTRLLSVRAAIAKLVGMSSVAAGSTTGALPIHVVPSERQLCLVVGLFRPRIIVSSSAWDRLGHVERRAVIAHEEAHVRQRDGLWRGVLGFCALFAFPLVARRLLRNWDGATERHCDVQAARAVGSPLPVVGALVTMAHNHPHARFGPAFGGADIVTRVEAVLEADLAPNTARPRSLAAWCAALIAVGLGVALVDELHHLLESALGGF